MHTHLPPKDPLLRTGPSSQKELFDRLAKACNGFSSEQVLGAAANLIINALRQTYTTQREAGIRFDELFGRSKSILSDHYDMLGRRKGIFPYDQNIEMMHHVEPKTF